MAKAIVSSASRFPFGARSLCGPAEGRQNSPQVQVGEHVAQGSREVLQRLASSDNLWERRIGIVSTLALIRRGEVEETFRISEKLPTDRHDLIHKAVGWMLREAGKVSRQALLDFLGDHYCRIPRTSLRYAIDRFNPDERRKLLAGECLPVQP